MNKETYIKINREAHIFRGAVINETALLEKHMEQIIADYFCGKTSTLGDELIAVILSEKLTFEAKRNALRYVIENAHKEFIVEHPNWFNDLATIMEQRNIFAHYPLSTDIESEREFMNGNIGFVKFKNKIEIKYYDKKKIHELTSMIIKYVFAFRKLLGLEESK